MFLVCQIVFLIDQIFFSRVKKFFCPIFSKAKILFPWIKIGYFDRPWSDQGVRKVIYWLKLKLGMLGNHGN